MKRLGIRKVATAVFNTKLVQGVDKVMNFAHRAPGDVLKTVADKTGLSKLKVDPKKKAQKQEALALKKKFQEGLKGIEREFAELEAAEIADDKAFERELAGLERDSVKFTAKVNIPA